MGAADATPSVARASSDARIVMRIVTSPFTSSAVALLAFHGHPLQCSPPRGRFARATAGEEAISATDAESRASRRRRFLPAYRGLVAPQRQKPSSRARI